MNAASSNDLQASTLADLPCSMDVGQPSLLHRLPRELLTSVLDVVDSITDLLQLAASCRLLRQHMNDDFWQRVLVYRCGANAPCEEPRQAVIFALLRTCHECRTSGKRSLPIHDIVRKRICPDCMSSTFRTICLHDINNRYKLTDKVLAGVGEMKQRNPYHKDWSPMRLFLLTDIERVSRMKLEAKARRMRRTEQKNKLNFVRLEQKKQGKPQVTYHRLTCNLLGNRHVFYPREAFESFAALQWRL